MDIQQIYPEDLEQYVAQKSETDYLLVDVREPGEYEEEHIPGARLLPLSELEGRLGELPGERELVFYCHSGHRSNIGAALAGDSGLVSKSIYNLVGGISAWEGKVLVGFPRLESLREARDLPQILEQAINMEKGTFLLYETMVKLSSGLPLEQTLRKFSRILSRLEIAHARAIYAFLSTTGQVESFDDLFDKLGGDLVSGGWDLEAAVRQLQENAENSCLVLSEFARELAYRAYDLYRSMAEKVSDVEQQRAMLFLAEQEKTHVVLVGEIEAHDLTGTISCAPPGSRFRVRHAN